MKPLERSVLDIIRRHRLISSKNAVLVGVSGGPDSTALLVLLAKLIPESVKTAAYIDHKLRPDETEAEMAHVKELCTTLAVTFDCRAVDVQNLRMSSGESPEACARRLRFEAFAELAEIHKTDLIALGHTRDDQVEEVLIRLIRGSGASGLSGMKIKNKQIVRPLLHSSKQEVLDYLAASGLSYCTDSSNSSRAYLRNKVRLDLIPMLEQEFNPAIKQTILNAAAVLSDEDSYLDKAAEKEYRAVVRQKHIHDTADREYCFTTKNFRKIPVALGRRVLEKMFHQAGCPPTFQAIEEIMQLTVKGRTGTTIHFSGGLRVIKTTEEIIFSSRRRDRNRRHRQNDSFNETISIRDVGEYPVPQLGKTLCIVREHPVKNFEDDIQYVDAHVSDFPFNLRAALPGEQFQPLGAPGKKKISRFFSDR
ncbi:MAG: tRNA lysidine(34) synthetase TilS, partial [Desulfocapsaceae bacterium]|nr:tRNA lysidine(34) synthetase TilS [Desulfocapsaceae bacterium]